MGWWTVLSLICIATTGEANRDSENGHRIERSSEPMHIHPPASRYDWMEHYLIPVHRVYRPHMSIAVDDEQRLRFHSDSRTLRKWQSEGFNMIDSTDRIVSARYYNMYKNQLRGHHCNLIELQSMDDLSTTPGRQLLYRSDQYPILKPADAPALDLPSLGYCAKTPSCGAYKPLRFVVSEGGDNVVYSTSNKDFAQDKERYADPYDEPICYLW